MSVNALERWLFRVKRQIEGDTRRYFCYASSELRDALRPLGFERVAIEKQFFVPMVLHRALARQGLSRVLEQGSRRLGLTRLLGGPVLLLAERPDAIASPTQRVAANQAQVADRVLLIAPQPFFTPSGTPLNVLQMCRELPELGYTMELLTLPFGETVPPPGVTYRRVARVPLLTRVPIGFSFGKAVYNLLLALALVRRLRARRYLAVQAIQEPAFHASPSPACTARPA
jgi:hypothetical protein